MPTIQNLLSRRCALADSLFVFQGTVSTDDFDVWVLLEPCGQRARTSVWQQVDWRSCFEIDDDRAIHVATPEREIIDTNDLRDGPHHWREQPCCTQHGRRTDHTLHPGEQCGTRIATKHDRDMLNGCDRPPTPTNVRGQSNGKSLAKDLLTARRLLTHETANGQFQDDGDPTGWEITQMTAIAAVNSSTAGATLRTSRSRLDAGGHNCDSFFVLHAVQSKPRNLCQEEGRKCFVFHTTLEAKFLRRSSKVTVNLSGGFIPWRLQPLPGASVIKSPFYD
ncbi:hypothetical protein DESA109040_02175 [Deinococcus saxicola]